MTENNKDSNRRAPSLKELRNDILREVYAEAEPGLDFDEVLDNPDDQPDDWYQRHYLSDERQREIFTKHVENFERELTSSEHADLSLTCITSLGPTANKELAEETRSQTTSKADDSAQ